MNYMKTQVINGQELLDELIEIGGDEDSIELEDVIEINYETEWDNDNLVKNIHLWNDGDKDKWYIIRCEGWKSRSGNGWEDDQIEMTSVGHEFISFNEESTKLFRKWVKDNFSVYLNRIDEA